MAGPIASISEIITSNEALSSRYESATAVFTGATQGIGLGTLTAFVKRIPKPRAIIVGRSRERFEDDMKNLSSINAAGEFIFVEGELSLIKSVDAISEQIVQHLAGTKVDLLCMSQGFAPLQGRTYTSEGLDTVFALVYYGRMRMAQNLIDAHVMSRNARVVTILAGTKEGYMFEDDLELDQNYSIFRVRPHFASLATLALDGMAAEHPETAFLHIFPGRVKTRLLESGVDWTVLKLLLRYVLGPIMFLGGITAEESGERMIWMALSEAHATGTWSLDFDGSESRSEDLTRHRQNRPLLARISRQLQQVFEKATAAS